MAFEHKQFDEWVKKLEKADEWAKVRKEIVDELANRLLNLAVKRTPVGKYPKQTGKKGGTLRRSWAVKINETPDSYEAIIYNDAKDGKSLYASYVEYGHRTRNKKGWVEGRFMLSKSEIDIAGISEGIIRQRLEAFLEELFNG